MESKNVKCRFVIIYKTFINRLILVCVYGIIICKGNIKDEEFYTNLHLHLYIS